ncbi:MAG TPA: diacylglycerol kinase family protein [Candidatus Acidoferrales bacterium]|nr:diacylglycerol kinase family protein [Candidatus Acidoferrales bacterium]
MKPLTATRELRPVPEQIRDAVIIYNPTSGRNRSRRLREIEEAARILQGSGIDARLLPTARVGSATELARDAAQNNCGMVVVCGGDGTINEVVNGIAGTDAPLAVLPAGTANILAKELGIPWNIPAAARLIARGKLARIALGLARWRATEKQGATVPTQRYFLCVSGAGPDGAIVHGIDLANKARVGILAYWLEGLRQFFTYPFPLFTVESAERTLNASLIVVGRTKYYGGPFRITVGASLFEDQCEVVAYTRRSRFGVLSCLPAIWMGRLHRVKGIQVWKTERFACRPVDGVEIFSQLDGEPASALPVEFSIVPDALTLVLPEGFSPNGA